MVPRTQWQAALHSFRSPCILWSSQLGSHHQNVHIKRSEVALMHGEAHHLFWTGIPTQQVCWASRVPVNMATLWFCNCCMAWPQHFSHAAPQMWSTRHPLSRCWKHKLHLGLASVGHPQRMLCRQEICLVPPSQVVLTQTRKRVSTQWARSLVILATELKAFKWETEVP